MKIKNCLLITLFLILITIIACSPSTISSTVSSSQPSNTDAKPFSTVPPPINPVMPWKADGIISTGEYPETAIYGDYAVSWLSDSTTIYISLKAKTTGWVAIGIQPGTTMKDADIIMGYVKDGKASIFDLYSTGSNGPHPGDTELGGTNDITEFTGKEEGGFTVIEFKRALTTIDKYDWPLAKGTNKIIYAFGRGDDINFSHAVRGYGQIDL